MNVTKPKGSLKVVADVSFRKSVTQLSGTYSGWAKTVALQIDTTNILYNGTNITKITLETREVSTSSMIGRLVLYRQHGGTLTFAQ